MLPPLQRQVPCLTRKCLKRVTIEEHSSLLSLSVSVKRKKSFITPTPVELLLHDEKYPKPNAIKLFFLVTEALHNKLDCLSLGIILN
jgi:hypothetical protein